MSEDRNTSEFNDFLENIPGEDTLTSKRFGNDESFDEEEDINEDTTKEENDTTEDNTEDDIGSESEDDGEGGDELTELKKVNQEMRRQMRLMEQKMEMLAQGMEKPTKVNEPEKEIDFLDGLPQDLDEVFTSKELVNKLFNKLAVIVKKQAADEAANKVTPVVDDRLEYQRFVDGFFRERSDLKKFDKYFYQVARDVASQNKTLSLKEVFNQAEKVTRKDLNLPRKSKGVVAKKSGGAIPSGRSSKRGTAKGGKSQVDQILELIG